LILSSLCEIKIKIKSVNIGKNSFPNVSNKFLQNTSIQTEAYRKFYEDDKIPIVFPLLIVWEHDKLNAVAKQTLMNNLSSFKNFFISSLKVQNKMLTRKFGITTNSGYFNAEALQTSILALYLFLIFGLMARSVHLVYASVHKEFFNYELWSEMADNPEMYSLEPAPEELLNLDSDDENLASSSFTTHQLPPITHHIMEEILNTSNHMIVDPPPVIVQEKGKS
jgi:hypothetical protein